MEIICLGPGFPQSKSKVDSNTGIELAGCVFPSKKKKSNNFVYPMGAIESVYVYQSQNTRSHK